MKSWVWWTIIGAALFAALIYKHQTCAECQAKWNAWMMHLRNSFANRVAQREAPYDGSVSEA